MIFSFELIMVEQNSVQEIIKAFYLLSVTLLRRRNNIPKKTLELSKPLSELDSPRSQVAGGRINDIASTSIASLDNAHPQRANNL